MKWFEIGLVSLTFLSGLIWLLDRLVYAKGRARRGGLLGSDEPVIVDYARSFFPILAAVLILRDPASLASGSSSAPSQASRAATRARIPG